MPRDLIIIGASGHGKVVADIARQMMKNGQRQYATICFLDDDETKESCGAYPVIGTTVDMEEHLGADFFVAIGDAEIREKMANRLEVLHAVVPVLIHPQAIIGENVSIGEGAVVAGGTVINPETVIGKYCIVNTGATVDHDCMLGDYVHVAPGAHICGGVHVGDYTWIGAGAIVVQNVSISKKCMVGAGAVVVNDIIAYGTYVGSPAKRK